jgi:hypothetical protein
MNPPAATPARFEIAGTLFPESDLSTNAKAIK